MTTHNIPCHYKKKITQSYPNIHVIMFAAMGFFPGTQERVRNSRGKRASSARANEVLLYNASLKISLRKDIISCYSFSNKESKESGLLSRDAIIQRMGEVFG